MSIAWSAGPAVNRYFADESLPARESAALRAFARRDPKTWASLAVNELVLAAVLLWFYVQTPFRDHQATAQRAALACVGIFAVLSLVSYLWWEWSMASRVKRLVARQAQVGSLLTSSFGPRALRVTTPDISYEIPYSSITHVVRFGDVLVIKPNNHLVMALPMELVMPADLALIESKVSGRPTRETTYS